MPCTSNNTRHIPVKNQCTQDCCSTNPYFVGNKNDVNINKKVEGTIAFDDEFLSGFQVDSYSVVKDGNIVNINITATRTGANTLLNTTFPVGTIEEGFRPSSNVSGLFPYGGGITDIGSVLVTDEGVFTFRTGNNASLPNSTDFTISLLFLI